MKTEKQKNRKRDQLLLFFLAILFIVPPANAFSKDTKEPWGKDADIAYGPLLPKTTHSIGLAQTFGRSIIRFHQVVLSPVDGPRSHYRPSSSQYMLEAVMRFGFFQGYVLGCDRLIRENNEKWVYPTLPIGPEEVVKYDPIPLKRKLL